MSQAPVVSRAGAVRARGYWLLVAAYFLVQLGRNSPAAVKADLELAFGLSRLQYSQLSAAFFYAYACIQLPGGLAIDTLGPRKTAFGGLAVMGLGTLLHGLSGGYPLLLLSRVLMGLGAGVIFLAVLKYQSAWFSPREFGTVTGVTTCAANVGGMLSQAPLIALSALLTWRGAFYLLGLAAAALALTIRLWVQDAPEGAAAGAASPAPSGRSVLQGLQTVLRNRLIFLPMAANLIAQGVFVTAATWGISYLTEVYGIPASRAGIVTSFLPLTAALATLGAGRLSDRLRSRRAVGTLFSALLCGILALPALLSPLPFSVAAVSLILTGTAAFYSVNFGVAKDLNPPELSGTAAAAVNLGTFAGAAVFPVFFGAILDARQAAGSAAAYRSGWQFLLLSCLALLCLSLRMPQERRSSGS